MSVHYRPLFRYESHVVHDQSPPQGFLGFKSLQNIGNALTEQNIKPIHCDLMQTVAMYMSYVYVFLFFFFNLCTILA